MTDHPHVHEHDERRQWLTLFAMCFALFMIMLDNTIVNVALPSIQRELHAGPSSLEWTVNAYVLTFATLILLGGKLGDRFGRRRMFIVGLVIFTIASAACALAQTDTQLIVFRALQGPGAALMNPLSLSIIVATFPRQKLPAAIGIWAGISGLGLAIGPVLGGFLVDNYGWSYVFWVNVPVGVIATIVCLSAVLESRDPSARSLDVVGTVLVTSGLFSLTYGLIKTSDHSWTSAFVLGFLGAAVVLLTAWLFWERRTREPMVPLGFFRVRRFTIANMVALLVGFGMFGSIYFITLYFQNVKGYTPIQAGVRSLPTTLMILVAAPVAGRLNARVGGRALMVVGMISATIGMWGLAQIGVDTSYNAIWPFLIVLGLGISLTMPSLSSMAMGAVDPRRSGIASGVVNSARQIGGAMGIAVLGSIVALRATSDWKDRATALPPPVRARTDDLSQLVVGGQGKAVLAVTHLRVAQEQALHAFVTGMRSAFWAGGALMLAAALVAFFGLMGQPVHQPAQAPGGAPAPSVVPPVEV
jgi:EmrB/QacA subfamily drug resistance transporter